MNVPTGVEDCICHSGEERERFGGGGGVYLERGEDKVGDEGACDGDFVLEAFGFALLFRLTDLMTASVLSGLIT